MAEVDLSIVVMTWDRNGPRLRNLLASLLVHQEPTPAEVIVVDTSTDGAIADSIESTVAEFGKAVLVRRRLEYFNKPWALNVGIKTAKSHYVGITDVDIVFGQGFVETLMGWLKRGNTFVMARCLFLPRDADISRLFERWNEVMAQGNEHVHGPGTIQAADRNWWFRIHGYDEKFAGGLGGPDDDVRIRAMRDGRIVKWFSPNEAQVLHQWHPVSPMKGRTSALFRLDPPVVANPNGWGEQQ